MIDAEDPSVAAGVSDVLPKSALPAHDQRRYDVTHFTLAD